MPSTTSARICVGAIVAALLFGSALPLHARDFIKGDRPQQRGYSQAVITDGGKTVWLAGQLAVVDDSGKSLAGDLDGQVRQIFKLMNATLEKAGGKLSAKMVQDTGVGTVIPIVFAAGTDPVSDGIVASLNRPGTSRG